MGAAVGPWSGPLASYISFALLNEIFTVSTVTTADIHMRDNDRRKIAPFFTNM